MKALLGVCALLFPIIVAAQALALSLAAAADSPRKVFRIGFLANTVPLADLVARVPSHPAAVTIEDELKKYGWVDGKNVEFVWKSAEGRLDRLPALAEELIQQRVDIILTFGGGLYAAANKTSTIPIVMVTMGDPVDGAYVRSLSRPGGNITGMTVATGPDLSGKRLSLLKEAVPKISRLAIVRQIVGPPPERDTFSPRTVEASKALGLSLFHADLRDPSELSSVFEHATRQGANAMMFGDYPYLYWPQQQQLIRELAIRHRLPVMHSIVPNAELGGVLAYASDIMINYRRAPYFIDRILRGAKPGDLPIEQPSQYRLIVNLKVARAIGITIPPSVLAQADQVIE